MPLAVHSFQPRQFPSIRLQDMLTLVDSCIETIYTGNKPSLYGAYSNLGEEEYSCLRPGEHFFNINYDKELNRISFKKMQFAVLYIYIYRRYMQHVLRHFYAAQYVLRAARAARSTLCAARSTCCVKETAWKPGAYSAARSTLYIYIYIPQVSGLSF